MGNSHKWFIGILVFFLYFFSAESLQANEDNSTAGITFDENARVEDTERDINKNVKLDNMVVTATRTDRNASEIPASVSVIDAQTIHDSKMMNIKDAMVGTPGVLIETKNSGYDSRLIIRGAGLKARYGIRDIMVLLDGVPITDPDSLTRLDFIDTQLIDQVEIVKGPNSTLWGANAAGGVVNIITKNPMEKKGGRIKTGVGSFHTYNTHLSFSGAARDSVYYTISASHRASDNSWRRWNEFETMQGTVQGAYVLNDGSVIDAYAGYTKADLQLPGKLDTTMFDAYLESGDADETEGQWQFNGRYSEIFFVNLRLSKQSGAFEFKPLIYLNTWSHEHPVTGRINTADTNTFGIDFQINHTHVVKGIKGETATGFSLRFDDQDTTYYLYRDFETDAAGRISATLSDEKDALSEVEKRDAGLYGLYFQETLYLTKHWILDTGIRFDTITFDILSDTYTVYDYGRQTYMEEETRKHTEKSYDSFSPRLGLLYKLAKGMNTYVCISKGIKTPTESEISDNPNLKLPEIFNYEAGLKIRRARFLIDTAFYYATEEDEVIQVVQEDNQSEYVNAGRTEKKGFELSAMIHLPFYVNAGLNYSWTDYRFDTFIEPVRFGRNQENMDRSGNRLPYIPEHQYALIFGFRHPSGIKAGWRSYFWDEYYMDNANSEKYAGYEYITHVMLGFERPKYDISLLIDNLFDKKYAVEATKDTSGEKTYAPAAPFSVMVKFLWNF